MRWERNFRAEKQSKKNISLITHLCLQEIVRLISLNDKDLGALILKLFKGYFSENENLWFEILSKLMDYIIYLKSMIDLFLNTSYLNKEEAKKIVEDTSISEINLMNHKKFLNQTLGKLYNEETRRIISENEYRMLEKEINKWIYNWESVHCSQHILEKLKNVDDKLLNQKIENNIEFKRFKFN